MERIGRAQFKLIASEAHTLEFGAEGAFNYRDTTLDIVNRQEWLDPLGFNNSFAMAVRGEEARKRHIETLTDAANDPAGFKLGAGYEFMQRQDGYATLNSSYPIRWIGTTKTMDLGLLYTALKQGQVSMAAGNTTDGMLGVLDVKVLKDDKKAFPPYQACIVVRADALELVGECALEDNETITVNIPTARELLVLCRPVPQVHIKPKKMSDASG